MVYFIDVHSIEYTTLLSTLFRSIKRDVVIYGQPLSRSEIGTPVQRSSGIRDRRVGLQSVLKLPVIFDICVAWLA